MNIPAPLKPVPPAKKLGFRDMKAGLQIGWITLLFKVRENPKDPAPQRKKWRWACRCGERGTSPQMHFTRANPKISCGCHLRTFWGAHQREYSVWYMMNVRCTNKAHKNYADYGGRGIKVCDDWAATNPDGFRNFVRDMGKRPSMKMTLDRIDNDKGYEKSNCRWATAKEQRANQRPRTYG
jgi:hypothetical protein